MALFYPRLALNFHTSLHSQQLVFLHHDSTTAGHVPKSQRDNTNLQILLHFYIKDFFLTSFPEISKAQVNGESCISKESRYSDENTSCSSPDFLPKRPMDLVTSTPVNRLRTESDSSVSRVKPSTPPLINIDSDDQSSFDFSFSPSSDFSSSSDES